MTLGPVDAGDLIPHRLVPPGSNSETSPCHDFAHGLASGNERPRNVVPNAPRTKPLSFYTVENRTHVELIPLVFPAGQVHVTLFRSRIVLIEHYIDKSLLRKLRPKRDFVRLKSLWRFFNRTLRPVNDEPGRVGIESGIAGTRSRTSPYMKLCKNLRIGDFNWSFEIGTLDRDLDCVPFCKYL